MPTSLGAPIVEVMDGASSYPGAASEGRAVDQMVRSLDELCGYAQDKADGKTPVWVLLETFDRAVDKRSLVGPSGWRCRWRKECARSTTTSA